MNIQYVGGGSGGNLGMVFELPLIKDEKLRFFFRWFAFATGPATTTTALCSTSSVFGRCTLIDGYATVSAAATATWYTAASNQFRCEQHDLLLSDAVCGGAL